MSVRPIDVQISIHRANEFTKQADLQNQKFNIDQLANARDFKQVVDHAQHQVVPTDQVYHNRIDKEQNRRYRRPGYVKTSQARDNKDGDVSSVKVEIKEQDKGLSLDIRI